MEPGQGMPRVIGDPVDPLRIGGPRGGIPGNLVGPNSGVFQPDGSLGGGTGGGFNPFGGDPSQPPDWRAPMGGPHDIDSQFGGMPGGIGRGRGGRGGFGGGRGGFGGGFNDPFGGGSGGFGGGGFGGGNQ